MIAPGDFADSLKARIIQEGFLPYERIVLGKRLGKGITLHEAIRLVLGMKESDSVYMYWEWRDLKKSIDTMWNALDDAASEVAGRRTSGIAFASLESRTQEEVLAVLECLDVTKMASFPAATRRPTRSESQVRFVGKLLGAIITTLGILESTRDSGFGDLFSSVSNLEISDVRLLATLDDRLADEVTDLGSTRPPANIVVMRALGWAFQSANEERLREDESPWSLTEFLRATDEAANWAGSSDKVVLRRLLAMSPSEKSETAKKAIERFLAD